MSDNLPYTVIDGIKCYSPDEADSYKDYPDSGFDLTDECADSSFWVSSRNRLFTSIVKKNMSSKGKTRLLEIGCGTGNFIREIVQDDNLEITGSEIYIKGLKYAKENIPGVEFVQFDVTQGKIDKRFQIIAAFDVIEHIENDAAALLNINQMLETNGVLIISVPQHMFLWSRLDEIVKHKRRYSRGELIEKLKANGFDICFSTSFLFFLFPLMLISRLFDKGKGRDGSRSNKQALQKRVQFSGSLNAIFNLLMRIDEGLIKMGISLPVGGTLVVVAKKQK